MGRSAYEDKNKSRPAVPRRWSVGAVDGQEDDDVRLSLIVIRGRGDNLDGRWCRRRDGVSGGQPAEEQGQEGEDQPTKERDAHANYLILSTGPPPLAVPIP
jgi:hypothetical protein